MRAAVDGAVGEGHLAHARRDLAPRLARRRLRRRRAAAGDAAGEGAERRRGRRGRRRRGGGAAATTTGFSAGVSAAVAAGLPRGRSAAQRPGPARVAGAGGGSGASRGCRPARGLRRLARRRARLALERAAMRASGAPGRSRRLRASEREVAVRILVEVGLDVVGAIRLAHAHPELALDLQGACRRSGRRGRRRRRGAARPSALKTKSPFSDDESHGVCSRRVSRSHAFAHALEHDLDRQVGHLDVLQDVLGVDAVATEAVARDRAGRRWRTRSACRRARSSARGPRLVSLKLEANGLSRQASRMMKLKRVLRALHAVEDLVHLDREEA